MKKNNCTALRHITAALGAAAGLSLFSPASSAAEVAVYGVIDTGLLYQNQSPDFEGVPEAERSSSLSMKSGTHKGSRWGLRGSEALSNGTRVSFILENGFESDTGAILFGDRLFGRQATLAIQGAFGELAFGRMGTLTSGAGNYSLAGWLTPFDTGLGAWSVAASNYMFGFQRADNALVYITPELNGLRLHLQYSFNADIRNDHSAEAGTQNGEEGHASADRYWALGATYKKGPADFAVVVDSYNWSSSLEDSLGWSPDDALAVTAGGSWNFGAFKFYLGVQRFENAWKNWIGGGLYKINASGDTQGTWGRDRYQDGWAITTGTDFRAGTGLVSIGAAYLEAESSRSDDPTTSKRWGLSAAYTYPFTKRCSVYLIGSWMHDEHRNVMRDGRRIAKKHEVDGFEAATGLFLWF